jgi:hypothetical protein
MVLLKVITVPAGKGVSVLGWVELSSNFLDTLKELSTPPTDENPFSYALEMRKLFDFFQALTSRRITPPGTRSRESYGTQYSTTRCSTPHTGYPKSAASSGHRKPPRPWRAVPI